MTVNTRLLIEQGTTWAVTWPILDSAGNPVTLNGWTVHAQIRASKGSPDVLHEWQTATGNAETSDNKVTLRVSATESSAWTWRTGVYDVELTDPDSGRVARIAEGVVTVSAEVTR